MQGHYQNERFIRDITEIKYYTVQMQWSHQPLFTTVLW